VPIRHDREFWERACRELEGGAKIDHVAARLGVRPRTLQWWSWKLRNTRSGRKTTRRARFLPVVVSESSAAVPFPSKPMVLEVDGVRVHVEVGTDIEYVAALVRAMRATC
jgi:transposase-like protein